MHHIIKKLVMSLMIISHITTNDFVIPITTTQIEEQEVVGNEEEEKNEDEVDITSQHATEEAENIEEEISLRRSTRITQPSTRLRDFIIYKVQYSIQNYLSYKNISKNIMHFLVQFSK